MKKTKEEGLIARHPVASAADNNIVVPPPPSSRTDKGDDKKQKQRPHSFSMLPATPTCRRRTPIVNDDDVPIQGRLPEPRLSHMVSTSIKEEKTPVIPVRE